MFAVELRASELSVALGSRLLHLPAVRCPPGSQSSWIALAPLQPLHLVVPQLRAARKLMKVLVSAKLDADHSISCNVEKHSRVAFLCHNNFDWRCRIAVH